MGGHGYATVRLTSHEMRTEFVASPVRSRAATDPMAVRSVTASHTPRSCGDRASGQVLVQQVIEGDAGLSI